MNKKPILFSTPMVMALLEGRKTMTRRTNNLDDINYMPSSVSYAFIDNEHRFFDPGSEYFIWRSCPYGKSDDLLWVRESFNRYEPDGYGFNFKADFVPGGRYFSEDDRYPHKWKPSIHMPKVAARIWLRVKSVRLERVQEINESDIVSEGVQILCNDGRPIFELGTPNSPCSFLPNGCFAKDAEPLTDKQLLFAHWASLWCKINGRESWDENPWVWVVEFEVVSTTGFSNITLREPQGDSLAV